MGRLLCEEAEHLGQIEYLRRHDERTEQVMKPFFSSDRFRSERGIRQVEKGARRLSEDELPLAASIGVEHHRLDGLAHGAGGRQLDQR